MNSIAGYLRVSSKKQETDNQLPSIQAWAESHGYNTPRLELYQENESAWVAGHQKELSRLLADLRTGKRKFDYLVVWSLDRLSRQGIAATLQLINSFEALGCKVVSIQESWVAESGPMREVFAAMAAWAAKFESDRRSERTRAGLERVKKSGKKLGRPPGRKDKQQRHRAGYLQRWAGKQTSAENALSNEVSLEAG